MAAKPQNLPAILKAAGVDTGTWRLWFPARLGPNRKRTKMVNGVKVAFRAKRPELPPTPNSTRGNPFAHAAWVKEWRQAGRDLAKAQQIPPLARVRISAVIKRRAIGKADEDNDRARLKPLVDGLRDAKVLTNDTRGHVDYGACTEERAGPEGPGVLLIVEALGVRTP